MRGVECEIAFLLTPAARGGARPSLSHTHLPRSDDARSLSLTHHTLNTTTPTVSWSSADVDVTVDLLCVHNTHTHSHSLASHTDHIALSELALSEHERSASICHLDWGSSLPMRLRCVWLACLAGEAPVCAQLSQGGPGGPMAWDDWRRVAERRSVACEASGCVL